LRQPNTAASFTELISWMQANLHLLDVPSLAARAGLNERSFYRKFTAATGQSPARFVEAARLDAARMLLSQGLTLREVAANVGLSPTSASRWRSSAGLASRRGSSVRCTVA
jgi:transcriptional regulator GlxA family with amidase domain